MISNFSSILFEKEDIECRSPVTQKNCSALALQLQLVESGGDGSRGQLAWSSAEMQVGTELIKKLK